MNFECWGLKQVEALRLFVTSEGWLSRFVETDLLFFRENVSENIAASVSVGWSNIRFFAEFEGDNSNLIEFFESIVIV